MYPSVQCFEVKTPTRSYPCLNSLARLDEMDVSEDETSYSIVVSSSLKKFHQDIVTSCKTLLKKYNESTHSMVAS